MRDFNNREVAFLSYRNRQRYSEVSAPKEKDKIVDVLCWALIQNHFHIMLQEREKRGASMFVQKLTGGYTMYFNPRHQRSGTLFQGRSKIISVERDAHFLHLPFYILANPLDIFQPKWREKGLKNTKQALEFLEDYRWSAFNELVHGNREPQVVNRKLFFDLFDTNETRLRDDFTEWLDAYEPYPTLPKYLLP